MFPAASTVAVPLPAKTNTGEGSPKRAASAGVRSMGVGPIDTKGVVIPSGLTMIFAGPDVFVDTLFPFAGFVQVIFAAPVTRTIVDPSGAVSAFANTLSTSCVAWIRNPQFVVVKPGPKSWNTHPSPRPPTARAGAAVATPASLLRRAPSATITPN